MSRATAPGTAPSPGQDTSLAPTRCEEDDAGLTGRMVDACLLGRLVPDLVHATSNDLQIVLGAAELLGLESASPATRRRLAMLTEAAAKAAGRMADVRALAQTMSGGAERPASAVTFAEAIIERGARLAGLLSPGTTLVVEIEPCLDEPPSPAPAEQATVERLLSCLVLYVQAIAPMEATQRLSVRVERGAGTRRVVLAVTCAAMDAASHPLPDPQDPDLALLSSLAGRADGTITHDPCPDGGTTISVTLPLRSSEGG